jgi:hypothetical protein
MLRDRPSPFTRRLGTSNSGSSMRKSVSRNGRRKYSSARLRRDVAGHSIESIHPLMEANTQVSAISLWEAKVDHAYGESTVWNHVPRSKSALEAVVICDTAPTQTGPASAPRPASSNLAMYLGRPKPCSPKDQGLGHIGRASLM